MTAVLEPMTAERRAQIVPPAQHQAELPPDELLHSGNAGVVVQKVGQLRSEYRNEGRMFAREMAKREGILVGGSSGTAKVGRSVSWYSGRTTSRPSRHITAPRCDCTTLGCTERASCGASTFSSTRRGTRFAC